LTEDELKYVAIDGAVSLECLEELINMPDIYRYLEMKDILVGKKLDIVPMRGDTYRRGAVATVVDQLPVECPANIIPSHGSGSLVRAGDGCCVVQVESIYSPALVIPGYATADRKGRATLKDLGCSRIVIPIAYLREHNSFYKPPLSSGNEMDAAGVTQPTAAHVQEARATQPTPTDIEEAGVNQPTHTDVEEAGVTQSTPVDVEEDLNNGDDEVTMSLNSMMLCQVSTQVISSCWKRQYFKPRRPLWVEVSCTVPNWESAWRQIESGIVSLQY